MESRKYLEDGNVLENSDKVNVTNTASEKIASGYRGIKASTTNKDILTPIRKKFHCLRNVFVETIGSTSPYDTSWFIKPKSLLSRGGIRISNIKVGHIMPEDFLIPQPGEVINLSNPVIPNVWETTDGNLMHYRYKLFTNQQMWLGLESDPQVYERFRQTMAQPFIANDNLNALIMQLLFVSPEHDKNNADETLKNLYKNSLATLSLPTAKAMYENYDNLISQLKRVKRASKLFTNIRDFSSSAGSGYDYAHILRDSFRGEPSDNKKDNQMQNFKMDHFSHLAAAKVYLTNSIYSAMVDMLDNAGFGEVSKNMCYDIKNEFDSDEEGTEITLRKENEGDFGELKVKNKNKDLPPVFLREEDTVVLIPSTVWKIITHPYTPIGPLFVEQALGLEHLKKTFPKAQFVKVLGDCAGEIKIIDKNCCGLIEYNGETVTSSIAQNHTEHTSVVFSVVWYQLFKHFAGCRVMVDEIDPLNYGWKAIKQKNAN